MYSGPSCLSSFEAIVAISLAVQPETRGLASSNGFSHEVCWSPGLLAIVSERPRTEDQRECTHAGMISQNQSTVFHRCLDFMNIDSDD